MTRKRLLVPLAAVLVLAVVGAGGLAIAAVSLSHSEDRSRVLDGTVTRVVVDSGSGDLHLQTIDGTQTRVHEHLSYFDRKPKLDATLRDGVLRLNVDCGSFSVKCADSLTVGVPRGVRTTTIELDSGDVELTGLDGDRFTAVTDSGDVVARSIRGDLSLQTDSGDVTGERLLSTDVSATSDSGDVSLELLGVPAGVRAETDSGDVEVRVPSDHYRVDADTDSGDVDIRNGVIRDDSSAHRIDARTDSGDVTVSGG